MFISISDYAKKWNVSTNTVRRWIKSGRLKAYKIGKLVRIPEDEIVQEVEEYTPIPHINMKQRLRGILE